MNRLLPARIGLFLIAAAVAVPAWAQGLLVATNTTERVPLPRPTTGPTSSMTYSIKELTVEARILEQVARVQVSQTFVNTGSRQMEVEFIFPLPYDGAVDRLTFLVDGKEIPAKLLKAEEARRIYERYIRRNQDPALLEWVGTGMFKTSVFPVPPGAERKVTLHYNQLLRKDHNLTDFLFPLGTAKYTSHAVDKVAIRASIESSIKIKSVYSPTHAVNVKRSGPNNAVVSYEVKNEVPTSDFRLFYDVAKGKLGASVMSYRPGPGDDGYFLLLASPQIEAADVERPKKTVICVFDRSGSMSGEKIEQAREALKFVLNNLREGDLFNVVSYGTGVESFRPELERFNDENRKKAIGFVEGLYAGGGTNISGALKTALDMLQDTKRPSYVIFLTDGLPTIGELNESKIVEQAKDENKVRARLFSFGVGYDVNSRLLDRLSRVNFGRSEYVRPNEDIEAHVSKLYNRIASPVMTDVAVDFEFDEVRVEEGPPINRMYPAQVGDLFEGEQLVVVGRYKKWGVAKVTIAGNVGDRQQSFDFPVDLMETSPDQTYAFVEKLWAMRRIGQIIDDLDLHGKNEELIKELVELSTKHGILTPYTSYLADENAAPEELARSEWGARKSAGLVTRLAEVEGKSGVAQRDFKQDLREAQQIAPASRPAPAPGGEMADLNGATLRNIDEDKDVLINAVKMVGNQVLYRRGNVWYTYNAAKRQPTQLAADQVKVIERFSDEYFKLVEKSSPEVRRLLATQKAGEELVIEAAAPPAEPGPAAAPAAEEPPPIYHVK